MSSKEGKLGPQFTDFRPYVMASLETQLIIADEEGRYADAFSLDMALTGIQFGLSQEAALNVVRIGRPNKYSPPMLENLSNQFQELSRQTGLGTVDENLVSFKSGDELGADDLAKIWSQVYGVEPEALKSAMEARISAFECTTRNDPSVRLFYVEDNLRSYYTQLKQAIS